MRIELAFFAEKIESRPDGRLNVEGFGPFTVGTSRFPVTLPDYHVPVLLYFGPKDMGRKSPLRFTILGPNDEEVMSGELTIDSPYPQTHKMVTVTLTNLELIGPGTYRIRFEADGQVFDGASFNVEDASGEAFRERPL
jgi:hypothetical protein